MADNRTMLQEVADDALPAVNAAYDYMLRNDLYREASELDEHELYLYVSLDGNWVIDHAQYFTAFRVYACAWLAHYNSVDALYHELEATADWDMEPGNA